MLSALHFAELYVRSLVFNAQMRTPKLID